MARIVINDLLEMSDDDIRSYLLTSDSELLPQKVRDRFKDNLINGYERRIVVLLERIVVIRFKSNMQPIPGNYV